MIIDLEFVTYDQDGVFLPCMTLLFISAFSKVNVVRGWAPWKYFVGPGTLNASLKR